MKNLFSSISNESLNLENKFAALKEVGTTLFVETSLSIDDLNKLFMNTNTTQKGVVGVIDPNKKSIDNKEEKPTTAVNPVVKPPVQTVGKDSNIEIQQIPGKPEAYKIMLIAKKPIDVEFGETEPEEVLQDNEEMTSMSNVNSYSMEEESEYDPFSSGTLGIVTKPIEQSDEDILSIDLKSGKLSSEEHEEHEDSDEKEVKTIAEPPMEAVAIVIDGDDVYLPEPEEEMIGIAQTVMGGGQRVVCMPKASSSFALRSESVLSPEDDLDGISVAGMQNPLSEKFLF